MKRRTKSEWQTLFAEHGDSGLSTTAFCRERGLNAQYFGKRQRQLQENDTVTATSSFVPVAIPARSAMSMLELQQGEGLVLKIPLSVSPGWLADLIQQLQA